jgi:hypothetical protein
VIFVQIYNFFFIALMIIPAVISITDITISYSLGAAGLLYAMASALFGLFGYKLWICVFHPELNTNQHPGAPTAGHTGNNSANKSSNSGGNAVSQAIVEDIIVPLDGKLPRSIADKLRRNASKLVAAITETDLITLREASRVRPCFLPCCLYSINEQTSYRVIWYWIIK